MKHGVNYIIIYAFARGKYKTFEFNYLKIMPNKNTDIFLDEEFLRKLEHLKLMAQHGIHGSHRGEYSSWHAGTSLEFLDYRKYQAGDDLRYVDWNVYGRLNKLFIKLFRAEKNQTVHILLDMSRSMKTGNPPKHICAKKIAAALCYICLANLNQIGITALTDTLGPAISPAGGRQVYLSVVNFLSELEPDNKTDLNACLSEYAFACKQPGIAVILSDLLDPKGIEKGLKALRYSRFDTSIIQVLDHEELFPSLNGNLILKDVETGEIKQVTPDRRLLETYQRRIQGLIEAARDICRQTGIDYHLFDTRIPFEDFLINYITRGTLF